MKRTVLLLIALVLLLCSCAKTTPDGAAVDASPKTMTDIMGKEFTLDGPAEKVVSLAPSNTELVFALGMEDRLIGVDGFSDYPEEAKDIAVVGDFDGPNIELIVSLQPDIVLTGNTIQEDAVDKLNELGIVTACTEAREFGEIYDTVTLLGSILGCESEAKALNDEMNTRVLAVSKGAEKLSYNPSMYYVISYGDMGDWTSGPGSFINTMMEIAGAVPVTADGGAAWMNYSIEELMKRDPDILLMSSDIGDIEAIKAASGYRDLTAVKEGRVYVIDSNVTVRPGNRICDGLEQIAAIVNKYLGE